jgi:hypothetical protein
MGVYADALGLPVTDTLVADQAVSAYQTQEQARRKEQAIAERKAKALEENLAKNKPLIDFSNQESFVLGGIEVPRAFVEAVALSDAGNGVYDENETVHDELVAQAWSIFKKIKAGKALQGINYHCTATGLRRFELTGDATLAK